MRSKRLLLGGVTVGSLFIASSALARTVDVKDAPALLAAIAAAAAGDEIVLAPGTYRLSQSVTCGAAGPIVVRSAVPLGAKVEFDALEGFRVTAPSWRFEHLDVRGVCVADSDCEHAFHVTGAATGFVLRGSRLVDFNAQLKVNAAKPGATFVQPNGGLVENNEVFDTHARATSNPVTKLNIDGVDDWIVRANIIHDGHKNGGDGISYQSFMKGGGKNGLFERNLILCSKDDNSGGTRIGLSFGGGGTAPQFCAPAFNAAVACIPEMTASTIRNNIIVNCSDVAIYLNQSKDTKVLYNTMIATGGVDFRFAATSGEADGNVLASNIRTRNGGIMTLKTNMTGLSPADFASFYVAPLAGDLRTKGDLARLVGKGTARADVPDDYCARARNGAYDLGALQASLGDCATTTPPVGAVDAGAPFDGGSPGAPGTSSSGDVAINDAGSSPNAAAPSASDEGCGCRTTGHATGTTLAWSALAFAALLLRRRRAW